MIITAELQPQLKEDSSSAEHIASLRLVGREIEEGLSDQTDPLLLEILRLEALSVVGHKSSDD